MMLNGHFLTINDHFLGAYITSLCSIPKCRIVDEKQGGVKIKEEEEGRS